MNPKRYNAQYPKVLEYCNTRGWTDPFNYEGRWYAKKNGLNMLVPTKAYIEGKK